MGDKGEKHFRGGRKHGLALGAKQAPRDSWHELSGLCSHSPRDASRSASASKISVYYCYYLQRCMVPVRSSFITFVMDLTNRSITARCFRSGPLPSPYPALLRFLKKVGYNFKSEASIIPFTFESNTRCKRNDDMLLNGEVKATFRYTAISRSPRNYPFTHSGSDLNVRVQASRRLEFYRESNSSQRLTRPPFII
jgi:hypothetical protein